MKLEKWVYTEWKDVEIDEDKERKNKLAESDKEIKELLSCISEKTRDSMFIALFEGITLQPIIASLLIGIAEHNDLFYSDGIRICLFSIPIFLAILHRRNNVCHRVNNQDEWWWGLLQIYPTIMKFNLA